MINITNTNNSSTVNNDSLSYHSRLLGAHSLWAPFNYLMESDL